MARIPIGDVAMTPAERARSYRARRKKAAAVGFLAPVDASIAEATSDMALIDALRWAFTSRDRRNGLRVLALLAQRAQQFDDQGDLYDPD